jgi:pyruvate/2-oxoglutarate dehydrogenase complex dihydrolipoamide dehydrogenase (E3) component
VPLGEFAEWDCDSVIYALGTKANPIVGQATQGLALDKRGYIVADEATQATNLPGVFAGGDIVTGGATVILAMSAGRRAAKAIGAWLQQREWPVTQAHVDAFVPPSPLPPLAPDAPNFADAHGAQAGRSPALGTP